MADLDAGCFRQTATTLGGLEPVLEAELKELGATEVAQGSRAVTYRGTRETLYRANLWLRTALKVLVPVGSVSAGSPDDLYDGARTVDWRRWLSPEKTFAVEVVGSTLGMGDLRFAALRVKDAVADYFTARVGRRPSVDPRRPDAGVHVYLDGGQATFSLDSTGESLHRRGYRTRAGEAPVNEVLAAGMLALAGYRAGLRLVDPFCGSGTICIEAALMAAGAAPGAARPRFSFESFADFEKGLWQRLQQERFARGRTQSGAKLIHGSDSDPAVVAVARENAERAGVAGLIDFSVRDFRDATAPSDLVVTNPPYGERIQIEEIETLYAALGDTLKRRYAGAKAALLSGNPAAVKRIGLRPGRRIVVHNGGIECRLLLFDLFAGRNA